MMTGRGKFIFIEGNDGAGKTTLIPVVAQRLRNHDCDVLETRQPDILRNAIFAPENENDGIVQLLLLAADCRIQLRDKVLPAIAQGRIVLSDRFFPFSTYVYQRERGVPINIITRVVTIACSNINGMPVFSPDLGILLDVDPLTGMTRKSNSGEAGNYFDGDKLKVQARRRRLCLAVAHMQGVEIVDANKSQGEVLEDVLGILRRMRILPKEKR